MGGAKAFYRRRAVRLLPAYYIALLVWLPSWINLKGGWAEGHTLVQLLTHVTFTHSFSPTTFEGIRGVFWFMGTLAHFVLVFPLLALAMRRWPLWTFLLGFAVSNLLRWGVDHYAYPQFWLSMSLPCRLGEFLAGMYAAHLAQHSKRSWLVWPLGGTALLAAPYVHSAIHPPQAPGLWWWGDTLFAPLWGGLVLLAVWYSPPVLTWRPLVYVGLVAYGAFLYNPLVYYVSDWAKTGTLSWWLLAISAPVLAGAINYAVFDARVSLLSRLLARRINARQGAG